MLLCIDQVENFLLLPSYAIIFRILSFVLSNELVVYSFSYMLVVMVMVISSSFLHLKTFFSCFIVLPFSVEQKYIWTLPPQMQFQEFFALTASSWCSWSQLTLFPTYKFAFFPLESKKYFPQSSSFWQFLSPFQQIGERLFGRAFKNCWFLDKKMT